ncbi:MAG: FimV family protein [Candidatus Porifericomitaceae bacterium WSBS_2022_MAG_OTU9]
MKHQPHAIRLCCYLLAAPLAFLTALPASALGLGEIEVYSNLNEKLDARIPIRATEKERQNLRVDYGSQKDFVKAGLPYNGQYAKDLQFSIEDKNDGSLYVIVVSSKPIREPILLLLIRIESLAGSLLREYTSLLDFASSSDVRGGSENAPQVRLPLATGNRTPAKTTPVTVAKSDVSTKNRTTPVVTPPGTTTKLRPARAIQVQGGSYMVQGGDTLWAIALGVRSGNSYSIQQIMLSLLQNNPDAFFLGGNINALHEGAVLNIPDFGAAGALPQAQAIASVGEQNQLWLDYKRGRVARAPSPLPGATAPPAQSPTQTTPRVTPKVVPKTATSTAPTPPPARPAAAPPAKPQQQQVEPRVQLLSADDGGGQGGDIESLRRRLAIAEEAAQSRTQEVGELAERQQENEEIINDLKRMVELRDNELTIMQNQIRESEKRSAQIEQGAIQAEQQAAEQQAQQQVAQQQAAQQQAAQQQAAQQQAAQQQQAQQQAAQQQAAQQQAAEQAQRLAEQQAAEQQAQQQAAEQQAQQQAAEQQAQQRAAEQQARQQAAEQAQRLAEQQVAEQQARLQAAEQQVQSLIEQQAAAEQQAQQQAMEQAQRLAEQQAAEQAQRLAEQQAQQQPAQQVQQQVAEQQPAEQQAAEQQPAEQPAEQQPAEQPAEQQPAGEATQEESILDSIIGQSKAILSDLGQRANAFAASVSSFTASIGSSMKGIVSGDYSSLMTPRNMAIAGAVVAVPLIAGFAVYLRRRKKEFSEEDEEDEEDEEEDLDDLAEDVAADDDDDLVTEFTGASDDDVTSIAASAAAADIESELEASSDELAATEIIDLDLDDFEELDVGDEGDIDGGMAEFNVLMAYGHYDKALDFIDEAIEKAPDNNALKVKRLEVYASQGDQQAFEKYASELKDSLSEDSAEWKSIISMWGEMGTTRELFATDQGAGEDLASTQRLTPEMVKMAMEGAESGAATDSNVGGGDDAGLDLSVAGEQQDGLDMDSGDAGDAGLDLSVAGEQQDGLDMDAGDAGLDMDAGDAGLAMDAGDAGLAMDSGDAGLDMDAGDAGPDMDASDADLTAAAESA